MLYLMEQFSLESSWQREESWLQANLVNKWVVKTNLNDLLMGNILLFVMGRIALEKSKQYRCGRTCLRWSQNM